ncbi:MAG: DUF1405 domain-containing protein [Candidatus Hydrothermarchaeota archaeon]
MNSIDRLSKAVFDRKLLLVIVLVLNLLGTAFGFYYYEYQFRTSPVYSWIFIPDCPLYTLLFSIILIIFLVKNRLFEFLNILTFVGLIKYGSWTVSAIALYSDYFLSQNFSLYSILFFAHIGMALESLVLYPILNPSKKTIALVFSWFLINDTSDYAFGTLPYLPSNAHINYLLVQSLFFTVFLSLLLLRLFYWRSKYDKETKKLKS